MIGWERALERCSLFLMRSSGVWTLSSAPNIYVTSPHADPKSLPPPARVSRSHLSIVNYFLEEVVKGSTSLDFFHREDCIEFEDFDVNLDNIVIKECEKKVVRAKDSMTVPVIRSQVGSKKRDSLRSNLLVFEARNFNADRGVDISTSEVISEILVDNFFEKCIDSRKFLEVIEDDIDVSLPGLSDWLEKRDTMAFEGLKRNLAEHKDFMDDMTNFKLMVKSDAKPKLDESVITKISTGQNIVYHKKRINAVFSNVFIQVLEKLKYCLASNIVLYNGMNTSDFASEVQSRVGTDINSWFIGELDISKYDKSQGPLFKQVEEKILRRFGVCSSVLDRWYTSEYDSSVTTSDGSLSASVGAQRRSGASNTWLGNTLINMCLQAYCGNFSSYPCICFAGDDSLIISSAPIPNVFGELSTLFGFDVKFFEHAAPYFCSKYLVSDGTRLYFLPDPYKLLVKLGRNVDSRASVNHENFISFVDCVRHFDNETLIQNLVHYHHLKYGLCNYTYGAFSTIHCFAANFSQYSRLFISRNGKSFGFNMS
nr:RNA polymerase [Lingue ampelovirus 1]